MFNKKISILGTGTVGCLNALKFSNLGYEIDWYYDSNIPSLSVGEGTDLVMPNFLKEELNFNYDLSKSIDAHYKQGVEKINWSNSPFTHWFGFDSMAMHFNASKLQKLIFNHLQDKVNIIEKNISLSDLNSYIIDCTGTPSDSINLNSTPIVFNKSYIVQCPWKKPKFDKTLCIAQSQGWVFFIPLKNRCSVGYLYNKNYTHLEKIKPELNLLLNKYNLTPQEEKVLDFKNYYRKNNFKGEVAYNGNASFFLEPMEATSLSTSIKIINQTHKILQGGSTKEENTKYQNYLEETIDLIMLHYLITPPAKTLFWEYANYQANKWFKERFSKYPKINLITEKSLLHYASWSNRSLQQNILGLDILDKLKSYKNG